MGNFLDYFLKTDRIILGKVMVGQPLRASLVSKPGSQIPTFKVGIWSGGPARKLLVSYNPIVSCWPCGPALFL